MSVEYKHSDLSKCLSEATGTFFLVLTVGCNVMVMSGGGALSIGGMLMCMVYALGSVSGAHFNPAVTAAIYLSGRGMLSLKDTSLYILSQCVGACVAGVCYETIFRDAFVLKPVGSYSSLMVMAVEAIYTMALCYVVLNVATTTSQAGNQYFGLAIGFTVVAAAVTIANISNCSLNPAVAAGSLVAALVAQGKAALGHYSIYFFMPFVGSIFGALAFYLVRRKDEYDPRGIGLLVVKQGLDEAPMQVVSAVNPEAIGVATISNSEDEQSSRN